MQSPASPHAKRRGGMAVGLYVGAPALYVGLAVLGLYRRLVGYQPKTGLTVFQSYMVGDLFMALPALKALRETLAASSQAMPLQIVCRPDCVAILQGEGFAALALPHAGFTANNLHAYWRSLSAAWALREHATTLALDTDADPRTAVLLRVMGCTQIYSYARSHALFFTSKFPWTGTPVHQSEKNMAVMRGFCQTMEGAALPDTDGGHAGLGAAFDKVMSLQNAPLRDRSSQQPTHKKELKVWVMAVTRKDTKNWPLPYWNVLLEKLHAQGVPFTLVDVPDGDAKWRAFISSWESRVRCVTLTLPELWQAMPEATHVLTLDNFFGHMAAYAGKPVLWVNGSSDAAQVAPRHQGAASQATTEVVQIEPMPCRPCGHRCTEARHAHCLSDLKIETVWPRVERFLGLG